ncbi:MAG: type II toxin-antitoxin system HicA family toxin [Synergistaceae bacterium]|nr:type II toxin-antitoxin system HicA family toxin [Synergistaceae bacterium]
MKRSELLRILKANGCYFVREGTNHEIWHSDITGNDFPVWRHSGRDIPPGTLRKIFREAGIE